MSANVSIALHENAPEAHIITCQDGRRFISFLLSPGISVYTHGFDELAVASCRSIAACMTAVADELERSMVENPPAPVVPELPQFEEEVLL